MTKAYQVLARKWRPAAFSEVVGQQHVTRTITNALKSERLAHAYIFAGLRGTGKTSIARILAKALNCESGPTIDPCGKCVACVEIVESRALDVLEIDAASRTKVEQTRELLELVSYSPVRDRYKILIIDEAHMLSKASFNALLKTLEEPPPHVKFILATTEIQKILPTIYSRCQVFEFRRVTVRELTDHLKKICKAEKVTISDSALARIARVGEGSVRDSLSVLERVLACCGTEVEDKDVMHVLGAVHSEVLIAMLTALAERDAGSMLTVLDNLIDEGSDLVHFWSELIASLRDMLFIRAVSDRPDLLSRSPEEAEALAAAVSELTLEDLTRAFQLLADLEGPLKSSSQPRFIFEATLVRLASLGAVRPIEEILNTLGSGGAPKAGRGSSSARPTQARTPKKTGNSAPPDCFSARFVSAVTDTKPMLGAILAHADAIQLTADNVTLHFKEGNDTPLGPLESSKSKALLAKIATDIAAKPVTVSIETSEAGASPAPAPKPKDSPPTPKRGGATEKSLKDKVLAEPGIKKLIREFGAHVVKLKPIEPPAPLAKPATDLGPMEEG